MRIALFCARMTGYSGVEFYTFDLALALTRARHRVTVHADGFAGHFDATLRSNGVMLASLGDRSMAGAIDVCVSPKYGPMLHAQELGAPCVQVIHSEHVTDVPVRHERLRGIVLIRPGQAMFVEAAGPWASELPRALIRNPIGFHRSDCDARKSELVKTLRGVVVSEFDDMKVNLARRYAELVGANTKWRVMLLGTWRSDLPVPENCIRTDASEFPWVAYRCAQSAFSYRYSRTLAEAAWCNTPCWVFGDLEGYAPTNEDDPRAWRLIQPAEVDLEAHAYDRVARQFGELFERVLA